mmetsp:Transcript_13886/g.41247  ORF Transcript_13886/g.41247 Transcript_13886/m.41247 type:complete len:231 (+) Transcript_13886:270-962(+)
MTPQPDDTSTSTQAQTHTPNHSASARAPPPRTAAATPSRPPPSLSISLPILLLSCLCVVCVRLTARRGAGPTLSLNLTLTPRTVAAALVLVLLLAGGLEDLGEGRGLAHEVLGAAQHLDALDLVAGIDAAEHAGALDDPAEEAVAAVEAARQGHLAALAQRLGRRAHGEEGGVAAVGVVGGVVEPERAGVHEGHDGRVLREERAVARGAVGDGALARLAGLAGLAQHLWV